MLGVRLNGFLASTAVALLLSGAGGGALAQSTPPGGGPAVTAPDAAKTAPAAAADPNKANATVPSTTEPTTPAASAAPASTPKSHRNGQPTGFGEPGRVGNSVCESGFSATSGHAGNSGRRCGTKCTSIARTGCSRAFDRADRAGPSSSPGYSRTCNDAGEYRQRHPARHAREYRQR